MSFPLNKKTHHYHSRNSNRQMKQYQDYSHDLHDTRRKSSFCLICVFAFFLGGLLWMNDTTVPLQTNSDYILIAPQETHLIDISNAVQVEITAENEVKSSFFIDEPPLTEEVSYDESESFLLRPDYYEYIDLFLKVGSHFTLSFENSAENGINFYIIKGDSEFSTFENYDDDFHYEVHEYNPSFSNFIFNSEESNHFYLVWKNPGPSTTINYTLNVNYREYDVSNPAAWKFGRFNQEKTMYPYIVLKNTDNSSTKAISYEMELSTLKNQSKFDGVEILGIILLVGITLFMSSKLLVYRKISSERAMEDKEITYHRNSNKLDTKTYHSKMVPEKKNPSPQNFARSSQIGCNCCKLPLDKETLTYLISNGYIFCSACGMKITL